MKKIAVVLGVVFGLSVTGLAQITVTNADLEKFRAQRLAADRDYRENYDKMGFPSPEELAAQRDRDLEIQIGLSDQLRQARIERERIQVERDALALESARLDEDRMAREAAAAESQNEYTIGIYSSGYGYGYGYGYPRGRYNGRRWGRYGRYTIPLIRATPYGVVSSGSIMVPRYNRRSRSGTVLWGSGSWGTRR